MPIEIDIPFIRGNPFETGITSSGGKLGIRTPADVFTPSQPNPFASIGNFLRSFLQTTGATQEQAASFTTRLRSLFSGNPAQVTKIQTNPAYVDTTIPRPQGFPTRTAIIGGTVSTTAIGGTLVLLNPGVQKTAQSFAPLGQGLGSITQVFANNPLLIVGGLILIGVVLLKK